MQGHTQSAMMMMMMMMMCLLSHKNTIKHRVNNCRGGEERKVYVKQTSRLIEKQKANC